MELAAIGYFSKPHGVKGQLILRTDADFAIDALKVLFVEVSGAKAPYFLSAYKQNNVGIIITLEDIDVVEKARMLIGKKVFIDATLIAEAEEGPALLGYELVDKAHGSIGKISAVTDNGHQVLITIDHKGIEVILPLVDEFIENVDDITKTVYFNAPEGLIDVYLEK